MKKENIVEDLTEILGEKNVKLDENMAKHSSFKAGGNAEIFVEINEVEQIKNIINKNKEWNLPITIIGNGSNILVRDTGLKGLVIKYVSNKIKIKDLEATVDSGVINAVLAFELLQNNLSGFEFAQGIPGTIGGAIFMNAGAFGSEMINIVKDVTYLDLDTNEIKTISNEECGFTYRHSNFANMNALILKTTLKLEKGDSKEIQEKMNSFRAKRMSSQPYDKPSAGSTFKRGTDFVTAQLIDQAGLKGYSIGGAQVSEKHAGFIINKGEATATDIIDLIEYVKEKVYEKFNKKIETEVRILG